MLYSLVVIKINSSCGVSWCFVLYNVPPLVTSGKCFHSVTNFVHLFSLLQILDKAGLKWEGFNAPIGIGEEEKVDDTEGETVQMRTVQKGWSGRTWPGRSIGSPLTADGGLIINNTINAQIRTQGAYLIIGN